MEHSLLKNYFKHLYKRTMSEAYDCALSEIVLALNNGGSCLDCGANKGRLYSLISNRIDFEVHRYIGIEWDADSANLAQKQGFNVINSDLNARLPFEDNTYQCVFGLSVLEHLLNPCAFLKESHRVLDQGGSLIILTPNISTYFTAVQILLGKMPSTGPHPDSEQLLKHEETFKVSHESIQSDAESDHPQHRHLVVFSYRTLKTYLEMLGFVDVQGHAYGLYPFPNFIQPFLEKLDPWHCHQMVFTARKGKC